MTRHTRLRKLSTDEAGFSLVFVAVGLMGFLAVSMLAIDVGMIMTARNQAQNSADAGALAGATALVFDSWDDRSATGPAVTNALSASRANQVMAANVSVNAADVVFLNDPAGIADRVKVTVYRDASRGNPVSTLIARYFGIATADISAVAVAEASPANAMTCVKPFTIPDRWREMQTPPFDASDTFDAFDNKGNPLPNADVYVPANKPGYTGYDAYNDKGTLLTIRAGTGNNISPSMYFSWKMPGNDIGADFYRNNITGCNTTIVDWNTVITQEPGDMSGPTNQGIDDLIAQDPNAFWNTATNSVQSSMNPSPRIFPLPLYDPMYYADGKANGRNASLRVANWLGFFVVSRSGNNVVGRITPIGGKRDPNGGPVPINAFPKSIRLVQ